MKKSKILHKRAVKDIDKLTKRQQLIDHASTLLLKKDFTKISMNDVAKTARIAKGTLYLYFQTKEELYLEILKADYHEWFQALHGFLNQTKIIERKDFVRWIIESLRARPRFVKMLPMSATILEQNVSEACISQYKIALSNWITTSIAPLEKALNLTAPSEVMLILLQIHIVAVGAWSLGFPNEQVQAVIKKHDLQIFDLDYFELLEQTLLRLLKQ